MGSVGQWFPDTSWGPVLSFPFNCMCSTKSFSPKLDRVHFSPLKTMNTSCYSERGRERETRRGAGLSGISTPPTKGRLSSDPAQQQIPSVTLGKSCYLSLCSCISWKHPINAVELGTLSSAPSASRRDRHTHSVAPMATSLLTQPIPLSSPDRLSRAPNTP